MDLGIRGRAALVGGASSGLGRASAERLAAEGCLRNLEDVQGKAKAASVSVAARTGRPLPGSGLAG